MHHSLMLLFVYVTLILHNMNLAQINHQWLLSWFLHKQRERLSITNLSLENNLTIF